jgi:hypothetical protein
VVYHISYHVQLSTLIGLEPETETMPDTNMGTVYLWASELVDSSQLKVTPLWSSVEFSSTTISE